MSSIQKAKHMAKSLRASLEKRNQEVSHSVALELVAQQLGYKDWNVASAMLPDENSQSAVTFDKSTPKQSPRSGTGFTAPNTARKSRPDNEHATYLDERPVRSCARRLSHQQSTRLQPETLCSAVALPR